ncbi:hypothetical protein FQA39_LY09902 [Lamprigera yunnana]|nr:hypothetical protein FQA39_LY09902 [Lamprigera yunnana]
MGSCIRADFNIAFAYFLMKVDSDTSGNFIEYIIKVACDQLHASFLINDDIVDSSQTRRGAPCWYLVDGIGMQAINDALLLENSVYALLRKHFSDHHCYIPAMELFHESIMKTSMGQSLDVLCTYDGLPQLEMFTMNRYNAIVTYKTAYYSFQLPVALALYLAGNYDPEIHRQATTILLEMGHFFQVQDDFLDCFGDPALTGKIGTDIQDGKCSWLVVLALQRVTPEQKQILYDNYGKKDPKCAAAVRSLYEDLGIPNTYAIYEEESYNLIRTNIQQVSAGALSTINANILPKIKSSWVSIEACDFMKIFSDLVRDLTDLPEYSGIRSYKEFYSTMFLATAFTGKIGTDIQDGKCSWLMVLALERVTPEQKQILYDNYGKKDPKCVAAIRSLYEDLGIPNPYAIYEEESYNLIRTNIQQVSAGLSHKLLYKFLESVYKRTS